MSMLRQGIKNNDEDDIIAKGPGNNRGSKAYKNRKEMTAHLTITIKL